MKGMDQIQERFDRTGEEGLPEAYLLGFDLIGLGDGKVILANGNPDLPDTWPSTCPAPIFAADIRLMDQRKYGDDPSLILVAVESACYRAK